MTDSRQLDLLSAPFQRHSDTSRAAADAIKPDLARLERIVYQAIVARGEHGATDLELQELTGLEGSTQRPRRIRLEEMGWIQRSTVKRPTPSGKLAYVYTATRRGRAL